MTLTLSADDQRRLAAAGAVLAAPLAYADLDAWRSAVNRALRAVVGADAAGFALPPASGGGPWVYSDEYDQAQMVPADYTPPPPLADGTTIDQRLFAEGVVTVESAYRGETRAYYRSWYYNEYQVPLGAADLLCLALAAPPVVARPDAPPGTSAAPEGALATAVRLASVQFSRGSGAWSPFGARECGLLRLLHPTFAAGVMLGTRWRAHRGTWLRTLDALGQAVLVCDGRGRALHQTPVLTATLSADPEAGALHHALARAAAAARALGAGDPLAGPARTTVSVRTAAGRYRVSVVLASDGGAEPLILAVLDRLTPAAPAPDDLRAAFGLTPAEVRVALLLAEGRTNAEVARALAVSPFTARRHTERVLAKLGVRGRGGVGARLHDAPAPDRR